MKNSIDILYMSRAIELALKGKGRVSTNPMVGAVIVCNDRIIGEGYHERCGEAHAEVNAINSISDSDRVLLPKSTMYVSLEPCSHWGKTPPCCDLIISEKIARVVIAMQDPFAKVNGEGIARLKANAVEVVLGVMEREAIRLNCRFITFHTQHRPYVILKWARTIDGFIDSDRHADEPAVWMTNSSCKVLVHKWRAEEDAIWVGKNTVMRDNPLLTVRQWHGSNPIRITMDRNGEIPQSSAIFNDEAATILYQNKSIEYMLDDMYNRGIQSVFVEGGAMLLSYLIERGLFDEVREFVSPLSLSQIGGSGKSGITAPKVLNCNLFSRNMIGDVELNIYEKQ